MLIAKFALGNQHGGKAVHTLFRCSVSLNQHTSGGDRNVVAVDWLLRVIK